MGAGWSGEDEFSGREMDAECRASREFKDDVGAVIAGRRIDPQQGASLLLDELERGRAGDALFIPLLSDAEVPGV